MVREAAGRGANLVLLQEFFETSYFYKDTDPRHFARATTLEESPAVRRFQQVAAELKVVLPVSFFERVNNTLFNALAMIDADGRLLGAYRKTHNPRRAGLPGEILNCTRG